MRCDAGIRSEMRVTQRRNFRVTSIQNERVSHQSLDSGLPFRNFSVYESIYLYYNAYSKLQCLVSCLYDIIS